MEMTIAEMKAAEGPHGELTGLSITSYMYGMMMGSDWRSSYSLSRENGEWILKVHMRIPFESENDTVYRVGDDVIRSLEEIVKKEELAALTGLKYVPEYLVTDQSSGSSIYLTFDDRSVGGKPIVNRTLDVNALRQNGLGEAADSIDRILSDACRGGTVISMRFTPPTDGDGESQLPPPGASAPVTEAAPGTWVCPECGFAGNEGRFCPECGNPRPK